MIIHCKFWIMSNKSIKVHTPWFIPTIQTMLNFSSPPPSRSPMKYSFDDVSTFHNSVQWTKCDYNIQSLIDAHPGTELSYDTDFRPTSILYPLMKLHPTWPQICASLCDGCSPSFAPIPEPQRLHHIMKPWIKVIINMPLLIPLSS